MDYGENDPPPPQITACTRRGGTASTARASTPSATATTATAERYIGRIQISPLKRVNQLILILKGKFSDINEDSGQSFSLTQS